MVITLIWLAHHYRDSRIATDRTSLLPARLFGIGGFVFMITNFMTPAILAEADVDGLITLGVQLIGSAVVLLFVIYQLYHVDRTKRHVVSLITGAVLPLILLTPVHELVPGVNPDPAQGMLLVGIVVLVLLMGWRKKVFGEDDKNRD